MSIIKSIKGLFRRKPYSFTDQDRLESAQVRLLKKQINTIEEINGSLSEEVARLSKEIKKHREQEGKNQMLELAKEFLVNGGSIGGSDRHNPIEVDSSITEPSGSIDLQSIAEKLSPDTKMKILAELKGK